MEHKTRAEGCVCVCVRATAMGEQVDLFLLGIWCWRGSRSSISRVAMTQGTTTPPTHRQDDEPLSLSLHRTLYRAPKETCSFFLSNQYIKGEADEMIKKNCLKIYLF